MKAFSSIPPNSQCRLTLQLPFADLADLADLGDLAILSFRLTNLLVLLRLPISQHTRRFNQIQRIHRVDEVSKPMISPDFEACALLWVIRPWNSIISLQPHAPRINRSLILLLTKLNLKLSSLTHRIIRIHAIYHQGYPPIHPPLFYPTQLSTGSPSNNLTVKTHSIKHPANSI